MKMSLNERLQEELEALEAILMDDISITHNDTGYPELVKTTIFPSTANEVEKQYVCSTSWEGYPDCEPFIQLRNPRGLDDSTINNLYLSRPKQSVPSFLANLLFFELIELIRENLTESNLPTCQCAVCLYGFLEGDSFTKTLETSYYDSAAFSKKNRINCLLGRDPLMGFKTENGSSPKELESAQTFEVTSDIRLLQESMKRLFTYQKRKGGIIDIEAEENKLLLITESSEDTPPSDNRSRPSPSSMSERVVEKGILSRGQRYDFRFNSGNR
ncbi:hypothetical protein NQ317_016978 [Molorchus minor]|uniref:RWD domain-containing protein n=1 Tax=Molorchus minor TaxID=1323400 RepID=A0ABQ9IVU9_9CUCU|nr:hypothetical protein NQ317_016978 [Molorchus minor]